MKKSAPVILIVLFLLSLANISAQTIRQKWAVIEDAGDKVTYIDTSSIRRAEDQISVWAMETYRDSIVIQPNMPAVTRIKTQYLLNKAKRKYSIIGKLYYDRSGRLVGESSRPSFSVGGESFALSLDDNEHVMFILKSVLQHIGEGDTFYTYEETSPDVTTDRRITEQQNKTAKDTLSSPDIGGIVRVELDEYKGNKRVEDQPTEEFDSSVTAAAEDEKERKIPPAISMGDKTVEIYDPISRESIRLKTYAEVKPNPVTIPEEKEDEPELIELPKRSTYDIDLEKNVTNTIFTDGKLFCFQVSSWKSKSIAERERDKLIAKGYNAFVVEAQPFGANRGTWYRVRVGYFDSVQEAKREQRGVK